MGFMSFELSQFAKSNDLFVAIFRYISFFSVKPMKEFEIFFLGKFSKKNHRQIKKKFFFFRFSVSTISVFGPSYGFTRQFYRSISCLCSKGKMLFSMK